MLLVVCLLRISLFLSVLHSAWFSHAINISSVLQRTVTTPTHRVRGISSGLLRRGRRERIVRVRACVLSYHTTWIWVNLEWMLAKNSLSKKKSNCIKHAQAEWQKLAVHLLLNEWNSVKEIISEERPRSYISPLCINIVYSHLQLICLFTTLQMCVAKTVNNQWNWRKKAKKCLRKQIKSQKSLAGTIILCCKAWKGVGTSRGVQLRNS